MTRIAFCISIIVGLCLSCAAQNDCVWTASGSATGSTYANTKLGFLYTFPAAFTAQDASLLPKDPKGKGAILFALWKTPRDIDVPSVVLFVEDPAQYRDSSPLAYAHRIENTAARSAKTFGVQPFDLGGMSFYKVDSRERNAGQLYAVSITGQIEKCEVSFQMRARTQPEIERLVESVKAIKLNRKPK